MLIFVGNFPLIVGKYLFCWIAFRILICFHNWSQKRNQFLFQLSSPRAIMQIRACGGRDQHMCKTLFNLTKNRAGRQKYKNTLTQTYTRSTCIYCVGLFEIYRTGNYKNAHICKMLDSDMTVWPLLENRVIFLTLLLDFVGSSPWWKENDENVKKWWCW